MWGKFGVESAGLGSASSAAARKLPLSLQPTPTAEPGNNSSNRSSAAVPAPAAAPRHGSSSSGRGGGGSGGCARGELGVSSSSLYDGSRTTEASSSSVRLSEKKMENLYEVLQTLGRGSFGVVRKVRRKEDGKTLVVKEMDYGAADEKQKEQIVAEVYILYTSSQTHLFYSSTEYEPGREKRSTIQQHRPS